LPKKKLREGSSIVAAASPARCDARHHPHPLRLLLHRQVVAVTTAEECGPHVFRGRKRLV